MIVSHEIIRLGHGGGTGINDKVSSSAGAWKIFEQLVLALSSWCVSQWNGRHHALLEIRYSSSRFTTRRKCIITRWETFCPVGDARNVVWWEFRFVVWLTRSIGLSGVTGTIGQSLSIGKDFQQWFSSVLHVGRLSWCKDVIQVHKAVRGYDHDGGLRMRAVGAGSKLANRCWWVRCVFVRRYSRIRIALANRTLKLLLRCIGRAFYDRAVYSEVMIAKDLVFQDSL